MLIGALVAAAGCRTGGSSNPDQIDCDSDIKYDTRKVEGSVAVGKFGAEVKTEVAAVRQIDQVVERYSARWSALCREYNGGVYTKEQYRQEATQLRDQMERLDALIIELENAPDARSYELALSRLYRDAVPATERKDVQLSFTVAAASPGSSEFRTVADGDTLRTGTSVYIEVEVATPSHVYLYQESPDGSVNVLFPHPGIPMANPVPAGQTLRIPPDNVFVLNDKDIGVERIYIAASVEPIARLGSSLSRVAAGDPISVAEVNCSARGLELAAAGDDCSRSRGLELAPPASRVGSTQASSPAPVSMRAVSSPGESELLKVFTFRHQ